MRIRTSWALATTAAIVLSVASGPATAGQGDQDHAGVGLGQAVTVDPLGFAPVFGGLLDFQYEQRVDRDHSWAARVGFGGEGFGSYGTYTALGVGGMYRFWIEHRSIQGWYWGPSGGLDFLGLRVNVPGYAVQTASGVGVAAGAEGGYQYVFPGGFTLDGALGLHYLIESVDATVGGTRYLVPFGGLFFSVRVGLGYAWR